MESLVPAEPPVLHQRWHAWGAEVQVVKAGNWDPLSLRRRMSAGKEWNTRTPAAVVVASHTVHLPRLPATSSSKACGGAASHRRSNNDPLVRSEMRHGLEIEARWVQEGRRQASAHHQREIEVLESNTGTGRERRAIPPGCVDFGSARRVSKQRK